MNKERNYQPLLVVLVLIVIAMTFLMKFANRLTKPRT